MMAQERPADHEADVEPPPQPQMPQAVVPGQIDRPRWKLSFKVEEDHAPRPRRRLNSTLHNGLWKGLAEAEKRAWMSQSADVKLARLLAHHLKDKVEYLNEPRHGRVPRAFKALKFFRLKKPRNERELAELIPLDPPTITFDGYELGRVYKVSCQILNASPWSQRLRAFLPCSRTFRVHADEIQGAVLAPGKSVTFDVNFSPTTVKDNVDSLFLSSEMDSCHVTLIGTNPFPTVFLPPAVNLGCCLMNHSTAASFPVAALEAASVVQITAESADSSYLQSLYSCQNVLYVPPFLAYPKTFSLGINESRDVIVMFRPQCTAHTSQVISLVTEYGHRWSVLLEGRGTDIKVELNRIDRRPCRDKEMESGLFFGKATICSKDSTRELTVTSKSLAPLRFYWEVEPAGEQEPSEAPAFCAHPCFGVLEPDLEAPFRFTFCPSEVKLYRQRAVLYLDTRQALSLAADCWEQFQRAVRNADNLAAALFSCRGNLLACHAHGGHAAASFCEQVFSTRNVDNGGGIVKGLEVELVGVGDPLDVEIYPPLLSFSEVLCQGKTYKRLVELRNNTLAEISFFWKTPDLPWVIAHELNWITVLPVSGKIGPLGKAAVDVTLRATKTGLFQETAFCVLKGGPAELHLPLLVEACVQGPCVAVVQPMLDFGLLEAGSTVSMDLTLINTSVVDAPFNLLAVCEGGQEGTPEAENVGGACEAEQEVSFTPACGTVPRLGQLTVLVNLVGCSCGAKAYAIVCRVANGLSSTQYALLRAFVDSPKAYFSPCKIDLGITFLHKRLTRTALLHNLTGLTTCFSWPACEPDDAGDTCAVRVDVTPRQGQLAPYGSQEFCFKMTPLEAGEKEFISVCDVMGAATPIGVLFRAYISDFRCSYHVLSPAQIAEADAAAADPYLAIAALSKQLVDTSSIPPLDFGKRCQLGCVHWLRLVLQNHTDISGTIHVALKRYGSSYPPPLSKEDYAVRSNVTGRPLTFPAGDTRSVLKTKKRKVPPLIDLPDEVHDKYWSPGGHYMVSRRLEIEMHNILINSGEGICLLVYPDCQGFIDSWGQQCLDVFCFSCLPGSYSDVLTCSVGGLSPVEIPVIAETVGTPLFARCQYIEPRGYQHPNSNPSLVLKWGPACVGNPARTRRFWVANVSTFPLEVKWDMKILADDSDGRLLTAALQPEDDSCVRVRLLGDAQSGPVQVKLEVVDKVKVLFRARENLVPPKDDCPFYVKPMKQVIPLKGNACFEVTFHASQAARHTCILLGRTRIPVEDEQGKRPSRRVTFLESTQILASDSVRRKSSVVTFSDKEAPEASSGSELIKVTTSAGALNEPVRASLRKPLLEATGSLRTAQGLLLGTRPERKASLKKTSIQIAGATLLSETGGRRSSLKKAFLADKDCAEDSNPEELVAYHPDQDPFTPLRVCLEAPVSEPRLKPAVDDALEFSCYETKSIVLRNEYTHSLTFTATVRPPFYIVGVESGLLSSADDSSSLQKADPESVSSDFLLPSEWSLRLSISFRPEQEVIRRDVLVSGDLILSFFEQYTQTIPLEAKVQFPAVRVVSESIWFGAVVVNAVQTLYFSVINDSYFDTHWQVMAEELVEEEPAAPVSPASKKVDAKKAAAEPGPTVALLEPPPAKESLPWEPFQVDVAGGLLRGRGARECTKQVVTVVFRPPRAKIYRQVFRIAAVHGRGCSLVVEGQGILERLPEPTEQPKKGK